MGNPAEQQIHNVVRDYVVGMTTGDEDKLRNAFHPSASIMGNYNGGVEWLSVDSFVAEVLGAFSPSSAATPIWNVASVDVTDDAAVVKVEDDFMGMNFTDYLSLLLIDGRWKIVNKLYRLHPS